MKYQILLAMKFVETTACLAHRSIFCNKIHPVDLQLLVAKAKIILRN